MHPTDSTTLTCAPPSQGGATPADARLIERSLVEPQAFAGVFDRHWPAIHRYCTSRAGAAGEDLAAEAFRLAFDRRDRYDRDLPDARPWLYGIATNLIRHHFRSAQRGARARRRAAALLVEDGGVGEPIGRLESQLLGPELTAALQTLRAVDREALLLLAWAELDYAEIARALDVPVGTVRSRIHRARARVRAHLGAPALAGPRPHPLTDLPEGA